MRQNLTIENKKIIQDEKLKLYKDYVEQTEPNGFRKQIFDIVTQIHTLQGYYDKPQSQNEIANSNNEVKQNNSVENEIIDNAFEENLSAENYTNKSEQEQQGDQEVEKETITEIESQDEIDTSKHFLTYTYEQFQVKYENLPSYKEQFDFNLTKKERIEANFEALELTQIIFKRDESFATEQEQEILAKFSGYGGLKTLFVDDKYETDRLRLENLVGKENYENLMQSSETAFYTPDDMIVRMYQGLTQMGVTYKDRVYALEPSCGIGKFISLAPANFEFEAVEKDTLTATIAKMLHPNVKIYNCGFEEVETYRQYDVVVGDPPFSGDIKIHDSRSRASGMSIHNYFAVRSAELLKEGGILNFVTIAKDSKTSQDETKINEPQEKLKSICKEDVLPGAEPNTNEIEIKEFSNSMSIEERLKILQVNQTNLKKTKHSKEILELYQYNIDIIVIFILY